MIVTAGPWDIPPAWWQQLAPAARIVVPLRWRGQARSIAFTRHQDRLVSDWAELCGFVPMLGDGQDGERTAPIGPGRARRQDLGYRPARRPGRVTGRDLAAPYLS